jgi:hypothetical protein
MIINHKLVLGMIFLVIIITATTPNLSIPVLAQSTDKTNIQGLTDNQLTEVLKYLKGIIDDKNGDKTFETITVSNIIVQQQPETTGSANCPDGTEVTGGGFNYMGPPASVRESKPVDNGWQVEVLSDFLNSEFTVYAQCGKLVDSVQ